MVEQNQRGVLQCAYVLHHRPYRDNSRLLEVFTRDFGRIGLVARGSRRRQRGGQILQPFVPLLVSWSGRGELWTLTHAETRGCVVPMAGVALLSGFYINELLVRLLQRQDPHPLLYDHYDALLIRLAALNDPGDGQTRLPAELRFFEKTLLESLGYGLVFDRTVDGAPVVADREYRYDVGRGFTAVTVAEGGSKTLVFTGASLLGLAGGAFGDGRALADAKRLMRLLIDQQLAGRPLQSRRLLVQWRRGAASAEVGHRDQSLKE